MGNGSAETLIQTGLIGEALDNGPVLLFLADEDMRYVAVNALACNLLGYTRQELLGLHVTDVCRFEEAPKQFDEMVGSGAREGEAMLTRKDGSEFRIAYTAGETRAAGMPFYISVARVLA
jgi:PAS domain S-box-containing protein